MFAGFGNRIPDGSRRFLGIHLRIVELLLNKDTAAAINFIRQLMQLAKAGALRGCFGSTDRHARPKQSTR